MRISGRIMKLTKLIFGFMLLGSSLAWADDPTGCDKFKWSIDRERTALAASGLPALNSGKAASLPLTAIVGLQPLADAGMPKAPERVQKPDTFAGFLNVGSLTAGKYTVTVSDYAWVDVVQNGSYLKAADHSSIRGCDGVRKSMKFDLAAGDAVIQLSGVAGNAIKMAVLPAAE